MFENVMFEIMVVGANACVVKLLCACIVETVLVIRGRISVFRHVEVTIMREKQIPAAVSPKCFQAQ